LINKKAEKAIVERSDTCAIAACAIIAESMSAMAITESFLEKFGGDTLSEIKTAYRAYAKNLDNL
jgi:chorismate synthase